MPMTAIELLRNYTLYNAWANRSMADWLLSKDQSLMEKELRSSFPTISKTLAHIWFGEHIWMRRIQDLPFENISRVCEGKPVTFICEGMLHQSDGYAAYTNAMAEGDETHMITYTLMSGETSSSPLADIIHHIMNHSTYHRGQVVTMGRELGLDDPPKTDYIHFCRMDRKV